MKIVGLILLSLLTVDLFGQNTMSERGNDNFWKVQERNVGSQVKLKYSQIQRTPYLNSNFQPGEIFIKDKLLGTYPLRYNVYTENFEFRKSAKQILELNNPERIGKIILGNATFIYAPYKDKNTISNSFFKLLNTGKAQGLVRYKVEFLKATAPGAYQQAQPARFSPIEKYFFVRFGDSVAIPVNNNSEFLKALPDHKQQVLKYMKKKRIHVPRKNGLVKLLNYYNSL